MQTLRKALILTLCFLLACPANLLFAGPDGGKVVAGNANISQSGNTTTINQSSNRAIVNWNTFDIGKNELVNHQMPGKDSAGLHRVVGGKGASQLEGQLKSNGNIFLVNPKGIVIHKGARIDTGGFVGSTADIDNDDFMKGNYSFTRPGYPDAAILNFGNITVRDHGFAALVAPTVRNEGVIGAKLGKVALGSGDAFTLDLYGDDLITFTVQENMVDGLYTTDGTPLGVENTGTIKAEGGVVLLTAKQLDEVVTSVVNNSGVVSAASAELKGGKIIFGGQGNVDVVNTGDVIASSESGDGGKIRMVADGSVTVSGTVEAKGAEKGGQIDISGKKETIVEAAQVSTEGAEGGLIRLGGEFQGGKKNDPADSDLAENFVTRFGKTESLTSSGNLLMDSASVITAGSDGTLIAWSEGETNLAGTLSAKYLETSGKVLTVSRNPVVFGGMWVIDPTDIVISATGDESISANNINSDWLGTYIDSMNGSYLSLEANNSITIKNDIFSIRNDNCHLRFNAETITIDDNVSISGSQYYNVDEIIGDTSYITVSSLQLYADHVFIGDNVSLSWGAIHIGRFYFSLAQNVLIGNDFRAVSVHEFDINSSNKISIGHDANINSDRFISICSYEENHNDDDSVISSISPVDYLFIGSGSTITASNLLRISAKISEISGGSRTSPTLEALVLHFQGGGPYALSPFSIKAKFVSCYSDAQIEGTSGTDPHIFGVKPGNLTDWPFDTVRIEYLGDEPSPVLSGVIISSDANSQTFSFDTSGTIQYADASAAEIIINSNWLSDYLENTSSVTIKAPDTLTVADHIVWSSDNNLTLTANSITLVDSVQIYNSGKGHLLFKAGDIPKDLRFGSNVYLLSGARHYDGFERIFVGDGSVFEYSAPGASYPAPPTTSPTTAVATVPSLAVSANSPGMYIGDNVSFKNAYKDGQDFLVSDTIVIGNNFAMRADNLLINARTVTAGDRFSLTAKNLKITPSSTGGTFRTGTSAIINSSVMTVADGFASFALGGNALMTINQLDLSANAITIDSGSKIFINDAVALTADTVDATLALNGAGSVKITAKELKGNISATGSHIDLVSPASMTMSIVDGSRALPVIDALSVNFDGSFFLEEFAIKAAKAISWHVDALLTGSTGTNPHIFGLPADSVSNWPYSTVRIEYAQAEVPGEEEEEEEEPGEPEEPVDDEAYRKAELTLYMYQFIRQYVPTYNFQDYDETLARYNQLLCEQAENDVNSGTETYYNLLVQYDYDGTMQKILSTLKKADANYTLILSESDYRNLAEKLYMEHYIRGAGRNVNANWTPAQLLSAYKSAVALVKDRKDIYAIIEQIKILDPTYEAVNMDSVRSDYETLRTKMLTVVQEYNNNASWEPSNNPQLKEEYDWAVKNMSSLILAWLDVKSSEIDMDNILSLYDKALKAKAADEAAKLAAEEERKRLEEEAAKKLQALKDNYKILNDGEDYKGTDADLEAAYNNLWTAMLSAVQYHTKNDDWKTTSPSVLNSQYKIAYNDMAPLIRKYYPNKPIVPATLVAFYEAALKAQAEETPEKPIPETPIPETPIPETPLPETPYSCDGKPCSEEEYKKWQTEVNNSGTGTEHSGSENTIIPSPGKSGGNTTIGIYNPVLKRGLTNLYGSNEPKLNDAEILGQIINDIFEKSPFIKKKEESNKKLADALTIYKETLESLSLLKSMLLNMDKAFTLLRSSSLEDIREGLRIWSDLLTNGSLQRLFGNEQTAKIQDTVDTIGKIVLLPLDAEIMSNDYLNTTNFAEQYDALVSGASEMTSEFSGEIGDGTIRKVVEAVIIFDDFSEFSKNPIMPSIAMISSCLKKDNSSFPMTFNPENFKYSYDTEAIKKMTITDLKAAIESLKNDLNDDIKLNDIGILKGEKEVFDLWGWISMKLIKKWEEFH